MRFIEEKILKKPPHEYKTPVERDWAFVVRREYIYDCNVFPAVDAVAAGLLGMIARQVMVKKFVMWPFFPLAAVTYFYRSNQQFAFFNKKYFDMINIGEQYELGYARNTVLKKCNLLLNREDF